MEVSPRIGKITDSILHEFKKIPTSTFSDALDSLGIQSVITGISPIVEGIRLVGPAMPVRAVSGIRGTYPLEDFAVGSVIDQASQGDVICFDLGGEPISTWGGLASKAAMNKRVAGFVANGGVRDIEEIRQLEFPVFARHLVPTSGKTRIKILSINKPIECSDVKIEPGDIIIGDSTGLVVIPSSRALDILEKAMELEKKERKFENELKKGGSFQETAKKLRHL
jgi:regulator of RNase E activity RraA